MSSGSTGIKRYLPSVSYLPDAIWNDTISHNWNNFSLIFKEWQCNGDPFGQFAFFCEGNCMHCHDWTVASASSSGQACHLTASRGCLDPASPPCRPGAQYVYYKAVHVLHQAYYSTLQNVDFYILTPLFGVHAEFAVCELFGTTSHCQGTFQFHINF